jgi:DNA repair exonuclease SbcCD ATPase subunit
MTLRRNQELRTTRAKLAELEAEYESARQRPVVNAHTRQATLQSLGQLITQLKEEIARYETRHAVTH